MPPPGATGCLPARRETWRGRAAEDAYRRRRRHQRRARTGRAAARRLRTAARRGDPARSRPVDERRGVGRARPAPGRRRPIPPFARGDAVTHPQYHLKLLLNRMGVNRGEVQPWHRAGLGKGPPERSHAISNLFLPPEAAQGWVDLPADKRRLSGVRLLETRQPRRRGAGRRPAGARRRWPSPNGAWLSSRPTAGWRGAWSTTCAAGTSRPTIPPVVRCRRPPAGRLFLLLAEVAAEQAAPVPLMALLEHPLVRLGRRARRWLEQARALELELRGPRPAPGLEALRRKGRGSRESETGGARSKRSSPR